MTITFETVAAVPTQERTKNVNPFTEKVAELAATADANGRSAVAAQFQVPEGELKRHLRYLSEAGKAAGVSVRRALVAQAGMVSVTFWTIPRITRQRKTAAE